MLQSAIAGLADSGGAYGILAICLILLHRTTGVLNFAVAAVGTCGTFLMSVLYGHGWPYLPAAILGVLLGAAISVAFGLALARWFFDSTPAYRAAVAIALVIGTTSLAQRVYGSNPRLIPPMVGGSAGRIDGVVVTWSGVIALLLTIALAIGITELLRRTSLGLRLRAIAQRPVTAELLGLPVRWLSVAVWAVTGGLATVALLLISPTFSSDIPTLSLLVVPALAAALVGSFRRYRLAVFSGLVLAALQGLMAYSANLTKVQDVIPFAVVVLLLLYFERKEVWDEAR
jgi:branched-chain amino acid transport system permease protein